MAEIEPTSYQREKYSEQHSMLRWLYDFMGGPGIEKHMSAKMLQNSTNAQYKNVTFLINVMRKHRILNKRYEWHNPNAADAALRGKQSFWTLQMPYDQAKQLLDLEQRTMTERLFESHSAAGKWRREKPITYSIGDEMPTGIGIKQFSPVDKQPKALVEAARQHGSKIIAAKRAFDLLSTSGIEIEKEAFFKLTGVPQDDRLETIAMVLPYIDNLLVEINELKAARKQAEVPKITVDIS